MLLFIVIKFFFQSLETLFYIVKHERKDVESIWKHFCEFHYVLGLLAGAKRAALYVGWSQARDGGGGAAGAQILNWA